MTCLSLRLINNKFDLDQRIFGGSITRHQHKIPSLQYASENLIVFMRWSPAIQAMISKPDLLITLHSMDHDAFDGVSNFLPVHGTMVRQRLRLCASMVLSYAEVKDHLLPLPFSTASRRDHGQFQSARHCFIECYSLKFIEKHNSYPSDAPQPISVNMTTIDSVMNETEDFDLFKLCRDRCSKDCVRNNYFVKSLH